MQVEFDKTVSVEVTLTLTSNVEYPETSLAKCFKLLGQLAELRQFGEADLLREILESYLLNDETDQELRNHPHYEPPF